MLVDEEGTAGKAYGARTTPHMYIVDPQGRLIYAGGIDSIPSSNPEDIKKAVNYVRQGLDEALAGKPLFGGQYAALRLLDQVQELTPRLSFIAGLTRSPAAIAFRRRTL